MCVAIYLPSGKPISRETLDACHLANKDSFGFMYLGESGIVIKKYLVYSQFESSFRKERKENKESDFVLHFRIGTSGKIDLPNCHPFLVTENIGLVHNGILSCIDGDIKESDTNKFCQLLGGMIGPNEERWDDAAFWQFIGKAIGTNNKLILLRKGGDFKIVNDKMGTWKDGVWFSNMNWEWKAKNKQTTTYTGHNGGQNVNWQGYGYGRTVVHEHALCKECKILYTNFADGLCTKCYSDKLPKRVPAISVETQLPAGTQSPSDASAMTRSKSAEVAKMPLYGMLVRPEDALKDLPLVRYHGVLHNGQLVLAWEYEKEIYIVRSSITAAPFEKFRMSEQIEARRMPLGEGDKFTLGQTIFWGPNNAQA